MTGLGISICIHVDTLFKSSVIDSSATSQQGAAKEQEDTSNSFALIEMSKHSFVEIENTIS